MSDRPKIDTSVPHSARIWNYWLGGKDNYLVDQQAGDAFLKVFPGMAAGARASRSFLTRTIRFLAGEAGIRQFLDVGTGLPTEDNTHEVAQRVAPQARVVYVDNDPLVLAHAQALLTSSPEGITDYVDADLHDPDRIMEEAGRTLDFGRPIALNLCGVMGHVGDDEEAVGIVRRLLEPLPAGSYLALSDGTNVLSEANEEAHRQYNESGALPYHQRSPEQLGRFFEGLEMVEPGLVMVSRWRPDHEPPPEVDGFGAVARKG